MGAAGSSPALADAGAAPSAPCAVLREHWSGFVDALTSTGHAGGPAAPAPAPRDFRQRAVWPAVPRLVAFGDLHGDLDKTRAALRAASLIDHQDRWVGGTTVAVQVGDILDRGSEELRILYLLERLAGEAERAGGRFHLMNGNHESMNVSYASRGAQQRYATAGAMSEFDAWLRRQRVGASLKAVCGLPAGGCAPEGAVAEGTAPAARARAAALCQGCPVARRFLEHRPHVLQVGSTVFAHGGLLEEHAALGLDALNEKASAWMRGEPHSEGSSPGALPPLLSSSRAIVWSRHYSMPDASRCDCDELTRALARTPGAARVVVGHTIQPQSHGINAACAGAALRVDVGMSAGCGGAPAAALEILDDGRAGMFVLKDTPQGVTRERVPGTEPTVA